MNASRLSALPVLPDALTEELVGSMAPAELSEGRRELLRERVLQRARDTSPDGTTTMRAASTWIECAPLIQMKVLRRDAVNGMQTLLVRMQAGGVMPAHRHCRDEEFIVLEGECHIGAHRLAAGDVHLAVAGSWHDAITTETGVVVLLRGEYPAPVDSQSALD
jgi:quercetin dioxygenase-like cupin family protein